MFVYRNIKKGKKWLSTVDIPIDPTNLVGPGRAGHKNFFMKSGRAGLGSKLNGPGWAGLKNFGPVRPLVIIILTESLYL